MTGRMRAGCRPGRGVLAALAVALLTAAAAAPFLRDEGVMPAAARPARAFATALGPAPAAMSAPTPGRSSMPSAPLFTTDDGGLIVGPGLLATVEFFLVAHPDQGSGALDRFLASRLPVAARDEAMRIGVRYRAYMAAYDDVLAAQNLRVRGMPAASVDLGRLASWGQQRRRLRQTILGVEVARQWYDNDDAQLEQAIEDLRNDAAPPVPGTDEQNPNPRYAPSRAMLRDEADQRARRLKRVLDDATIPFAERLDR